MGSVLVLNTQRESIRTCIQAEGMVEITTGLRTTFGFAFPCTTTGCSRGRVRIGDHTLGIASKTSRGGKQQALKPSSCFHDLWSKW
jgi:hypothetical protein